MYVKSYYKKKISAVIHHQSLTLKKPRKLSYKYLFSSCFEVDFFLVMEGRVDGPSYLLCLCVLIIEVKLVATETLVYVHRQTSGILDQQLAEERFSLLNKKDFLMVLL